MANDAVYAPGFARTTTSMGGRRRNSCVRMISRSLRLSRLRDTADCRCLGTTSPTRGCAKGEAMTRTSRCSVRNRFPFVLTCRSSARCVSRWLRGNASDSGACVLGRQLNGEPLAALLATTAENCAAPFCCHALAESMGTDAALVAWTIGGLAHEYPGMRTEATCGTDG